MGQLKMGIVVVIKHGGPSKRATLQAVSSLISQSSDSLIVIDDDKEIPWQLENDIDRPGFIHVASLTFDSVMQALRKAQISPIAVLTFKDPAVVLAARVADYFNVLTWGGSKPMSTRLSTTANDNYW